MALDINALKSKLNSFNRKGNREERDAMLWKPPEGKSVIRIVPLKDSPKFPFIELMFHYDIGPRAMLSPTSFGGRDPISEFADALIADESVPIKERYAQAKPFRPKARTYLLVVVRGEESKGPRLYAFGTSVYKQIASYMVDEDYGDITDVEKGRDITIEYTPKDKSDTKLPQTDVKVKPNTSQLTSDATLLKKWLSEQPNVREMFDEVSYAQLKAALEKHLDPSSTTSSDEKSVADEEVSITAQAAKPKGPVAPGIDAFGDLFDDKD